MYFLKVHGCGNDFILSEEDLSPWATELCDRRLGVGADGILIVKRLGPERLGMEMINPDGTASGACGNGLRCVARYGVERMGMPREFSVLTGSGERRVRFEGPDRVAVEMGPAVVAGSGDRWHVDVGNPHVVILTDDPEGLVAEQGYPEIPYNLHGVDVMDFRVLHYERGAGHTLACGSGACAVAAAVWEGGLAPREPLELGVPGGRLIVIPGEALTLIGPAAFVFEGEWHPPK